jgi:hypothetical protein
MMASFMLRVALCVFALLFSVVASSSSSVETPYGPISCMPFMPDYSQCIFSYQQVKYNLTSANNLQGDYWATLDDLNIYYMQPCMQTITACVAPLDYFKNEAQACQVDQYFTQVSVPLSLISYLRSSPHFVFSFIFPS